MYWMPWCYMWCQLPTKAQLIMGISFSKNLAQSRVIQGRARLKNNEVGRLLAVSCLFFCYLQLGYFDFTFPQECKFCMQMTKEPVEGDGRFMSICAQPCTDWWERNEHATAGAQVLRLNCRSTGAPSLADWLWARNSAERVDERHAQCPWMTLKKEHNLDQRRTDRYKNTKHKIYLKS